MQINIYIVCVIISIINEIYSFSILDFVILLISEGSNNPSWNIISRMISDMKISSQRLNWREQEHGEGVVSSSMPIPWTVLNDVDDLIKHIFDFAQSLVKNNNNKKQVKY